jgi:hypothetical protein
MAKTRNSLGFPLKERNLLKTSAADRIMVYYFKGFFFSPKSWTPIGVFFLRGKKRLVRDVDMSPPPSTEVKNEYSYTSTTPTCLRSLYRINRGFYRLLIMASTFREGWKSNGSGISCHEKQLQGVHREGEKCLWHSKSVTWHLHMYSSDESSLLYLLSTLLS